jgi:hypothetical protein
MSDNLIEIKDMTKVYGMGGAPLSQAKASPYTRCEGWISRSSRVSSWPSWARQARARAP